MGRLMKINLEDPKFTWVFLVSCELCSFWIVFRFWCFLRKTCLSGLPGGLKTCILQQLMLHGCLAAYADFVSCSEHGKRVGGKGAAPSLAQITMNARMMVMIPDTKSKTTKCLTEGQDGKVSSGDDTGDCSDSTYSNNSKNCIDRHCENLSTAAAVVEVVVVVAAAAAAAAAAVILAAVIIVVVLVLVLVIVVPTVAVVKKSSSVSTSGSSSSSSSSNSSGSNSSTSRNSCSSYWY